MLAGAVDNGYNWMKIKSIPKVLLNNYNIIEINIHIKIIEGIFYKNWCLSTLIDAIIKKKLNEKKLCCNYFYCFLIYNFFVL